MNFGSDHRVRDAFRATLLDEPSSAVLLGTQEIDAADVLEVSDLANAIARAEEVLRARSSRAVADIGVATKDSERDIFDALLGTDDAVGPAVHVPYLPTPLPPRGEPLPPPPGVNAPPTLLRAPEAFTPIPVTPRVPNVEPSHFATAIPDGVVVPPAPRTAPILVLDEDAFYHPAGRIRTIADATLDGFRPEPTLVVRLRERRTTLSWLVLLVLAPVVLVALFAAAMTLGRASVTSVDKPQPVGTATILPAEVAPPPVKAAAPVPAPVKVEPAVPVFDVNSLKSAPAKPSRR